MKFELVINLKTAKALGLTDEWPTRASSQLKTTLGQSYEAAEALAIEEHEQVLRDMGAGQDR